MEAFWKAWAAHEATTQWFISYRDRGHKPPPVEAVELLDDKGVFRVTFKGGSMLDVVPTGLAKVSRVAPLR